MKQKQTTPAEETEDKRPNETPDGDSSDGESSDGESSDGLKEAGESMLSHLMALRKVLLISAAAVLIGFVLVFYLAIDPLMAQILAPIQARGIQVIFTTMSEALVTKFKVALLAGMMIASPVVIWEIWGFIKPALYLLKQRNTDKHHGKNNNRQKWNCNDENQRCLYIHGKCHDHGTKYNKRRP